MREGSRNLPSITLTGECVGSEAPPPDEGGTARGKASGAEARYGGRKLIRGRGRGFPPPPPPACIASPPFGWWAQENGNRSKTSPAPPCPISAGGHAPHPGGKVREGGGGEALRHQRNAFPSSAPPRCAARSSGTPPSAPRQDAGTRATLYGKAGWDKGRIAGGSRARPKARSPPSAARGCPSTPGS